MLLETDTPVEVDPEMFGKARAFAAFVIAEFDKLPEGTFPEGTDRTLTILHQVVYQSITALRKEGLEFSIKDVIESFADVVETAVEIVHGD